MPSTPKLSDIWEYTLTEMLGHNSKSETSKVFMFWVKTNKLEEFYQLLLWDVDDFTDHRSLSSFMEKADSEETFHMPSAPLKLMLHCMKFVQCISSQAPGDMELDHEDHPLALSNWTQHSNNTSMKCVLQQQTDNFTPKPSD